MAAKHVAFAGILFRFYAGVMEPTHGARIRDRSGPHVSDA